MQLYKRDAVNRFWADYVNYTAKGLAAGAIVAVLVTQPSVLLANPVNALIKSPILPLYAGVAGGIALSQCAERFNRLQQLESKVMQSQANAGKEESR